MKFFEKLNNRSKKQNDAQSVAEAIDERVEEYNFHKDTYHAAPRTEMY